MKNEVRARGGGAEKMMPNDLIVKSGGSVARLEQGPLTGSRATHAARLHASFQGGEGLLSPRPQVESGGDARRKWRRHGAPLLCGTVHPSCERQADGAHQLFMRGQQQHPPQHVRPGEAHPRGARALWESCLLHLGVPRRRQSGKAAMRLLGSAAAASPQARAGAGQGGGYGPQL